MTVRAIFGLAVLNSGFVVIGGSLLWAVRGWRWWTDAVRLAGLAYFMGVAAMIVLFTVEIVIGIPFGTPAILATGTLLVAVGLALGGLRRHTCPHLAPSGWRVPTPSLFVAFMLACVVLWLEASFRASRLQPLWLFDAWWVWTSRAKSLYFDGDLGGVGALRGGDAHLLSYPPGLSIIQAQGFEAMGSVDTVTLHLQNWFFALAFIAAVSGLLAGRVRAAVLLPVVLLTIVMPTFSDLAIWPLADPLLAYLIAVAALLICLWLEDRSDWLLVSAAVVLGGAVLVKREAALFVLVVLLAAAVASWSSRRSAWRSLSLAAVAIVGVSASWTIWLRLTGTSQAPTGGYLGFVDMPGRGLDSAQLVASTFLGARWGLPMGVAVAALLLAVAAGARRTPVFVGVFLVVSFASIAFLVWAEPFFAISQDLSLNPAVRLVMGTVVVICPLTALMLESAWTKAHGRAEMNRSSPSGVAVRGGFRGLAWGIVVAAALIYPVSAALGIPGPTLPGGTPSFPGASR